MTQEYGITMTEDEESDSANEWKVTGNIQDKSYRFKHKYYSLPMHQVALLPWVSPYRP